MRASRSWPRSSVPNGCLSDGPARRAVKSMSLIGTRQMSGPKSTARTITVRITVPRTARWWRRKRRPTSAQGELLRARFAGSGGTSPSAVGDAGVEPAIEQVGDEVEEDHEAGEDEGHRHDHGRVVGEDRADEERPDAGHAEDLLGHDGAAEDRGHLQREDRKSVG